MWKLNNTPEQPMIKEEIQREIRKYFETKENKNTHTKAFGMK